MFPFDTLKTGRREGASYAFRLRMLMMRRVTVSILSGLLTATNSVRLAREKEYCSPILEAP
ncbi:hypothetical protein BVX99_00880 [bacterium F16]|nr:hypothetical protein BVX99_00880 [bacterium F16]